MTDDTGLVTISVSFERADGKPGHISMAAADRSPEAVIEVLEMLPRGAVVETGGVSITEFDPAESISENTDENETHEY